MEVRFLRLTSGGQTVVGTARVSSGAVVLSGDISPALRDDLENGVVVGPRNKRVYMDEGEKFLRALPRAYAGAYFRAELVE